MEGGEETLKSRLVICLTQQISEIEVLTSIYPDSDDIIFTDPKILHVIKDFINNRTNYTPNHLDFTLNLNIDSLKLEISINLPSFYPEEEPDIYVRCNQLNRQQETALNKDLSDFIKKNHFREQCLYTAISWLQENIEKYYIKFQSESESKVNFIEKPVSDNFCRLWIYSHHIYNKKKREEIVKLAREYSLTGFCLPGKPGVVCLEGPEQYCKEWWKIIKSMCWKKIVIRKTETFKMVEMDYERKFKNFEEIHFDMSSLSKYLDDAGLGQAFNDFFGLCNSNS